MHLDQQIREQLLSILVERGLQSVQDYLRATRDSGSSFKKIEHKILQLAPTFVSRILTNGREVNYLAEEAVKGTSKAAREISDSQFLSDIVKTDVVQGSILKPLADEAHETAVSCLKSTISNLVEKLTFSARRHRQEQCMANVNTGITNLEEREQCAQRSRCIHEINQASIQDNYV